MTLPRSRRPNLPPSRVARGAAIAALVVSLCGCTVWQNVRRTVIAEPFKFSWKFDRNRSLRVYSRWADQEYARYAGDCATGPSDDFGAGFRDGFVDYVYAGGTGEPPPVPPREFWNIGLRTPEGRARADQWFAGYRQGAAAARDGGYRNQSVVPSSYPRGLAMEGAIEEVYDVQAVPELIAPEPAISAEELPASEDFPSPATRQELPATEKGSPSEPAPPESDLAAPGEKGVDAVESPKSQAKSAAPEPVKLPPAPLMLEIDASDEPSAKIGSPENKVEPEEASAGRPAVPPQTPEEKSDSKSKDAAPAESSPAEEPAADDPFGRLRMLQNDPVAQRGLDAGRRQPTPVAIEPSSAVARGELQVIPTAEPAIRPGVVADLRVMPAAAMSPLPSAPAATRGPSFTEIIRADRVASTAASDLAPAARPPAGNPRFQLSR